MGENTGTEDLPSHRRSLHQGNELRRQGGRRARCTGLLSGDNLALEFASVSAANCMSLEKGVSNVNS